MNKKKSKETINKIKLANAKPFKLFLFLFIFSLLILPSVYAQDGTAQVNKAFKLSRGCFNNGNFCDSSFECNITLISPNNEILIENQIMTHQSSRYNITINSIQNNQMGFIEAIQSCSNTTAAGAETFEIQITADGFPFQQFPTQFSVILFAFLLVALGLSNERMRLFQAIGSMLMVIMGIITIYPGYSFINWTTLFGKGLGFSLIGMGLYFMIEHSFSRDEQKEYFSQEDEFENE